MSIEMSNIFVYGVILLLIVMLLFLGNQVRRIWFMKNRMERFLGDLRTLNERVLTKTGPIPASNPVGESLSRQMNETCEFCKSRITYVSDEDNLFSYSCRRDNRIVDLDDTCEHFVLDLHGSKI